MLLALAGGSARLRARNALTNHKGRDAKPTRMVTRGLLLRVFVHMRVYQMFGANAFLYIKIGQIQPGSTDCFVKIILSLCFSFFKGERRDVYEVRWQNPYFRN